VLFGCKWDKQGAVLTRSLFVTASCLFASGMCALVYQTVWLRAFRLIFGASTPSTAAVLAIFLGGLGVGGLVLGRRVERSARPLVTYAYLELGIAATAAITPFLLEGARALYVGLGGSEGLGDFGSTFIRLVLSTLVLGVPCILMGGTLPAAARAVTSANDLGRKGLSVLYGVNTLGAVTGALLSTFLLLEIYGARQTLWLACLVNVLVAMAARSLGRNMEPVVAPAPRTEVEKRRGLRSNAWVLTASFTTGFVFLLVELVWYRLAAPLLGGSTYSFGLVLACALFGVGAGGVLYAVMGPKTPTPARFAVTCALEALLLVLPFAAGDQIAYLTFFLREWGETSFPLLVVSWAVIMAMLVMPAALIAGYQFPMLLALKGEAAREVGKDSGEVYAANTLGSILGSLGGGFGLLPALTAVGLWKASGALLLLLSFVVAIVGRKERGRVVLVVALAGLTLVCLTAEGPTAVWRHSPIGAGRADLHAKTFNERISRANETQRNIIAEADGRESALAMSAGWGLSPLVNGKSDGNSYLDAPTGIGSGLLPAVFHGDPKKAFVIGLGTGQTAGWLAALPAMEKVDVVEIEPEMISFARRCEATNQGALSNPKLKMHIADGRELLLVTDERYDLILSEPSNPYRAGIAGLYSQDFYRAVADRLSEGGVFGQWMQGYEVEPATIQLVVGTLKSVFPHLSAWQLGPGDMFFLATREPQQWDMTRLRALVEVEPYKTIFPRLFGVVGAEGVIALHLASDELLDPLSKLDVHDPNTDDQPRLEYMFARSVGTAASDVRLDLHAMAAARGASRPEVKGEIDWQAVEAQRARPYVWRNELVEGPISAALPDPFRLWLRGRPREAIEAFSRLDRPLDPFEHIVKAAAHADAADEEDGAAALEASLVEAEKAGFLADAAWLRVKAALVDRRAEELPRLTEAAGAASRLDPWPAQRIVDPVISMLANAPVSSETSAALVGSLKDPFVAYNFHIPRLEALLTIERRLSTPEARPECVEVVAAFEPYPRWRADFLDLRRRCYERHLPERAAAAAADSERFAASTRGAFQLPSP
jgi:spermidine synthase